MILDVRRLRILHAVNEYGSVTAAAAALGYSAPAVSQQLAAPEREVGMELTERAGRGIGLTEMEPEESLPAVLRGEVDNAVGHEYDIFPRPIDRCSSGASSWPTRCCWPCPRPARSRTTRTRPGPCGSGHPAHLHRQPARRRAQARGPGDSRRAGCRSRGVHPASDDRRLIR
jgi:hypothetical protein